MVMKILDKISSWRETNITITKNNYLKAQNHHKNQELHHTGKLMTMEFKKRRSHQSQRKSSHFAEVEDTVMFQEKPAEFLLLQLHQVATETLSFN